jgi:hypothetical protein
MERRKDDRGELAKIELSDAVCQAIERGLFDVGNNKPLA